ncbi:MAG TPA: S46 family peptidase [Chitinophagaceae bacterium]|nr:S46 family peptidase [Chitinophagaceae bacterium]
MKKQISLLFIVSFLLVARPFSVAAEEGMWLPQLLEKLNEKEMKSLGMKISAKDIYNISGSSLKDAIVSFGGFCTGEVISSKGLVLTNHHCGFGSIQNHSTLDHNYIRDGFWAKNNGEEIPNQRLFVTFIVRIDEVTKQILTGVHAAMSESERQSQVDKNMEAMRKAAKKESYQDVLIRGFFENNQYFLFVTETYNDVRLVGAPPSAIGNFGKDTDNWVWPRHTGDFSLFRIYAGKDNKPAAYSPDNIPYTPKRSLSVSLDGVKENDFTMVFGFPGRTMEYLPASAVKQIMTVNNPIKIAIREKALTVLDGFMRKDEQIKIQYASKYAGIQNAYKKWQGEVLGLTRTKAIEKKENYEKEFLKRIIAVPALKIKYGTVLNELNEAYAEMEPYGFARDYFTEISSKIELFTIAAQLNALATAYEKGGANGYNQKLSQVKEFLTGFYKDYNEEADKKLFEVLVEMYVMDQSKGNISPRLKEMAMQHTGDFKKIAEKIYGETEITRATKTTELLQKSMGEAVNYIRKNATVNLFIDMLETYQVQVQRKENEIQERINKLQRIYMQAQLDAFKEKRFYPDANRTMRVTYGKVKGYDARDGVKYDFYTYLDGVMEKYVPGDYEFDVPEKLKNLYQNKDYGPYASNGKMPVCFIATNHTTGGNSGSPALDASGNLVGINFDRAWEGTMSDINYDPSICRNIMVDIRYILFIIDKYADAGHLVKEMKLVGGNRK